MGECVTLILWVICDIDLCHLVRVMQRCKCKQEGIKIRTCRYRHRQRGGKKVVNTYRKGIEKHRIKGCSPSIVWSGLVGWYRFDERLDGW